MSRNRILLASFLSLIVIGLAIGLILHYNSVQSYDYSGKCIFNTVQEYSTFKEHVGNPNVSISGVDVLSSEPPIVVTFSVSTPHDYHFPYGDKQQLTLWPLMIVSLIPLLAIWVFIPVIR